MNEQLLIEVYVPAIQKNLDLIISKDLKVFEMIQLLAKVMNNSEDTLFRVNEQTVICMRDTGDVLDINLSARKLKLKNSERLMLI